MVDIEAFLAVSFTHLCSHYVVGLTLINVKLTVQESKTDVRKDLHVRYVWFRFLVLSVTEVSLPFTTKFSKWLLITAYNHRVCPGMFFG